MALNTGSPTESDLRHFLPFAGPILALFVLHFLPARQFFVVRALPRPQNLTKAITWSYLVTELGSRQINLHADSEQD